MHFKDIRDRLIGQADMLLKGEGQIAESNMVRWQKTLVTIRTKLEVVDKKVNEIYGSPQKPMKKKNYALKKVEEPPSDNE